ncbi:unnamed protein product [Acanthoscelides obtectus]|uniref:Ninein n=1 Tax=Acanthoscelides obtectus TaxID=200917 RepID=A0A9P0KLQ1_ACAOB|nr:unnamed protein product [Acanthoscelides obtectus]CAK1622134.1 Blastoderm-specific protein 25D [Acanthoscelides obtectus]
MRAFDLQVPGVGDDGFLNQEELVLVCDAIGLHKLAEGVIRQLSDKLSLDYNHRISFQELLEVLQQDDTWYEVLNPNVTTQQEAVTHRSSTDKLFPDSQTFQFVTLGPDGNGVISTDVLIEMWENVGIHSPKELLHELGFNARTIKIAELAELLDKQIKTMNDSARSEYQSPHITLLQASLSLYQSEIRCFKGILEQMHAEREKLKLDVVEANNRATMLAQEVDDNHSRMEQNTLNQVKLLEQRHNDILKEVTAQYSKDKEQLSVINQALEEKIYTLEQEANKLKNDLLVAQKYSLTVEKDNQTLTVQINDLERDKSVLSEQIGILENEKQKYSEMGREESKVLLVKLNSLQTENSILKDKNDEMVCEIECLSNQVASMRMKSSSTPTRSPHTLDHSMEENISIICEGVGVGAKRRNDYSPSKDVTADGSPRLGKLRKFHRPKPTSGASSSNHLEVPFASSESGFDTEVDVLDSSVASSADHDEVTRLQARVAFLEQVLRQHGLQVAGAEEPETNGMTTDLTQLTDRVNELENIIAQVKKELVKIVDKDCVSASNIKNVVQKLEQTIQCEDVTVIQATIDEGIQTEGFVESFEEKVRKLEKENEELCTKCNELENCVELLRTEYEKCEDYWQNKVDEERQMFEAEQKINSDKLADLIVKMKEYEEQYATQESLDSRLPTIDETYNLEKQFTDLEQEFEEYKAHSENEIFKRDEEIALLKEKLTELALKHQTVDCGVQVSQDDEGMLLNKMQNFSSYVVESTNRSSEQMMPPNGAAQEYPSRSSDSTPINWSFNSPTNTTASASSSDKTSTPCRPKRTRKHDKNVYKKNQEPKKIEEHQPLQQEKTVTLPLSSFHNLTARKNYLEQRVRYLQMCIKQQHYCSEQTLQHYWHQFKGERSELHNKVKYLQEKLDQQIRIGNEQLSKLERNDLMVKELFIENSYLVANVQRLEQQCHMLIKYNNCASSV